MLFRRSPLTKVPKPVYFYDLRTQARRQLGTITTDVSGVLPNLAVSPDGSRIYYSTMEIFVAQIRMVEGGI